jgi:ABC-type Zn2+ transport system substrate-binding protein/surface adhesin
MIDSTPLTTAKGFLPMSTSPNFSSRNERNNNQNTGSSETEHHHDRHDHSDHDGHDHDDGLVHSHGWASSSNER